MASIKEKYEKMKARIARGRHHAGRAIQGVKPFAFAGGAGALGQELTDFAAKHSDWVRNSEYGNAAVLAAGAFAMRKKNRDAALGLAGAAGYAWNYDRKVANVAKGKSPVTDSPARPFAIAGGGSSSGNTTGFDDDAGMLIEPLPAH